MRSLFYWTCVAAFAVGASVLASQGDASQLEVLEGFSDSLVPFPMPSPERASILGFGIIAVAITYRRAWLNWRRSSAVAS